MTGHEARLLFGLADEETTGACRDDSWGRLNASTRRKWDRFAEILDMRGRRPVYSPAPVQDVESIGRVLVRWLETCRPEARGSVSEVLRAYADAREVDLG